MFDSYQVTHHYSRLTVTRLHITIPVWQWPGYISLLTSDQVTDHYSLLTVTRLHITTHIWQWPGYISLLTFDCDQVTDNPGSPQLGNIHIIVLYLLKHWTQRPDNKQIKNCHYKLIKWISTKTFWWLWILQEWSNTGGRNVFSNTFNNKKKQLFAWFHKQKWQISKNIEMV